MTSRRLLAALLTGALVSWGACNSEIAFDEWMHGALQRFPSVESAEVVSTANAAPLRMVEDYRAAEWNRPRPQRSLPLAGDWRGGDDSLRTDGGTLVLDAGDSPTALIWETELPVGLYNEFRVRMRVSAGTEASLAWQFRDGTRGRKNVPIRAGDEIRTLVFPLPPRPVAKRPGEIAHMELRPSDVPASVEIEAAALWRRAPAAPRRVGLAAQTLEAILGPLPPWRVTVPADGVFDVAVGLVPPDSDDATPLDAPTVRIFVEEPGRPRIEVAKRRLQLPEQPSYQPLRVDLESFAGRTLSLHAEIDDAWAEVVVWGNPRIITPDPADRIPVVLISIDTLRADHLSCYGYARETTPHLDHFAARDAVLFERAITEETYTLPAHTTMMTGLHPNEHGVDPFHPLGTAHVTLAERLRDAGYTSAAFTGVGGWLRPRFGLDQGFDEYVGVEEYQRTLAKTVSLVGEWLDARPAVRPFLFVHTFDVHAYHQIIGDELPYGPTDPTFLHFSKDLDIPQSLYPPERPPGEPFEFWHPVYNKKRKITETESRALIALYDDAIRWVDSGIGELFEILREKGLYDPALIIVTSDHGESQGEHDLWGHGSAFGASASIPLLIKFPASHHGGTRNDALVQLVDLQATVLDVLGLEPGPRTRGISLLGVLEGRTEPRALAYTQRQGVQSVRSRRYKLTANDANDEWQLYDLSADPGEDRGVQQPDAEILDPLRQAFEQFYRAEQPGWHLLWQRARAAKQARTRIRVASAEPLVRSARLAGDRREDIYNVALESHAIAVDLHEIRHEELVVASRSPDEPLRLVIDAEKAIDLLLPNAAPQPVENAAFWLDPAQPGAPPESRTVRPETPRSRLSVWYVAPTASNARYEDSSGEPISDEQIEELRALGYVD